MFVLWAGLHLWGWTAGLGAPLLLAGLARGLWQSKSRVGAPPLRGDVRAVEAGPGSPVSTMAARPHPASLLSAAQYFASTMIIVGLSVVVTVIVLQYHHHDPDGGKMPKWVRSSCPLPQGGTASPQRRCYR